MMTTTIIDYYGRHYYENDEYGDEYGDEYHDTDDRDFTACDKDDCGYCGHCPY
jgi:hypothetical protein